MDTPTPADRRTAAHSKLTPAQRRLRAQRAANARWSKTDDRAAGTQAARDTFLARFLHQVDPENRLPADERERRAESARKSHMQGLAFARHRTT